MKIHSFDEFNNCIDKKRMSVNINSFKLVEQTFWTVKKFNFKRTRGARKELFVNVKGSKILRNESYLNVWSVWPKKSQKLKDKITKWTLSKCWKCLIKRCSQRPRKEMYPPILRAIKINIDYMHIVGTEMCSFG